MKKENIQTKIKKIIKFGVLSGIKESYLLVRNLYGFWGHPFLTTKRIVDRGDLSQGMLIFSLPLFLWLAWVFVLLVSRIFIVPFNGWGIGRLRFGFLATSSAIIFSSFIFGIFSFLAYWLWMVIQKKGGESENS